MCFQSLLTKDVLLENLDKEDWLVFDCRSNLLDQRWGQTQFEVSHIPGAFYVDLNNVLSSAVVVNKTGRHPLPSVAEFLQHLKGWGVTKNHQLVIYDQKEGMFASRLWWLLRWCGFSDVAVLDGGWMSWQGHEVQVGLNIPVSGSIALCVDANSEMFVSANVIEASLDHDTLLLIDARSADRYRGENEMIDTKAGHIPGAISSPFVNNLTSDGYFLSQDELRAYYKNILGESNASDAVVYCGSGVTATHNILAMYYAGLGMARLYPGSWSEWIVDNNRPIAIGD